MRSRPPAIGLINNLVSHKGRTISGFWKAASLTHPSVEHSWLCNRLKFFARVWFRPLLSREWLHHLTSSEIAPLWRLRPRLASKLQRPYQCAHWSPRQRLDALLAHYTLFPRLVSPAVRAEIYGTGYTLLCIRNFVTQRELQIRLFYRDQFEKEGELTLGVFDHATNSMLAGVTFSLGHVNGRRTAFIGGLQASRAPQTRALIHDVAKEMYGMRPKSFALWCLQTLLARWDVTELRAVGDEQHIYRHWRKRREIAASYNEFWQDSDGTPDADGGSWSIPLKARIRSRQELKPSRRKAHERRYAMLGEIAIQLSTATARLAVGSQIEIPADRGPFFEYGALHHVHPAGIGRDTVGAKHSQVALPSESQAG